MVGMALDFGVKWARGARRLRELTIPDAVGKPRSYVAVPRPHTSLSTRSNSRVDGLLAYACGSILSLHHCKSCRSQFGNNLFYFVLSSSFGSAGATIETP